MPIGMLENKPLNIFMHFVLPVVCYSSLLLELFIRHSYRRLLNVLLVDEWLQPMYFCFQLIKVYLASVHTFSQQKGHLVVRLALVG